MNKLNDYTQEELDKLKELLKNNLKEEIKSEKKYLDFNETFKHTIQKTFNWGNEVNCDVPTFIDQIQIDLSIYLDDYTPNPQLEMDLSGSSLVIMNDFFN